MPGTILAEGNSLILPHAADLIWSTVIIAIIAVAFWRLLPKFTAILDERTAKIEGGLELAEKSQQEADKALAEYTEMLASARAEAAKIREEARAEGAQIVAELRTKAQEEAERITEAATRTIEAERQQVIAGLRSDVAELATDLASRIVGEAMADEARQSRVIDRFLDELDSASTPAELFQEK